MGIENIINRLFFRRGGKSDIWEDLKDMSTQIMNLKPDNYPESIQEQHYRLQFAHEKCERLLRDYLSSAIYKTVYEDGKATIKIRHKDYNDVNITCGNIPYVKSTTLEMTPQGIDARISLDKPYLPEELTIHLYRKSPGKYKYYDITYSSKRFDKYINEFTLKNIIDMRKYRWN